MIKIDKYDKAFVGLVFRFGMNPVSCYDYEEMIRINMEQGMSRDEAEEFFYFNQVGAWVGEATPCFLERMTLEEAVERSYDEEETE